MCAIALVGACVAGMAVATSVPAGAETHAKSSARPRWDPRIAKFVRFVERTRGLVFDHPIPVVFLDDTAFVAEYNGDGTVTRSDRNDADHYAGALRALGLIEGDVDLIAANADLDAAGVTGFYDDVDKRMVIRGSNLDDLDVRLTVVHELTHALQDQRFGLHKLDRSVSTSGEDFAVTAAVEGDASYVEDQYLFSRPRSEQNAYFGPAGDASSDVDAPEAPDRAASYNVPPILETLADAPYVFGVRFVSAVAGQDRDNRSIDRMFANLPRSEEQIVDGVAYRNGDGPDRVRAPRLQSGEQRYGPSDDFGAFSLYLVLASRLDPKAALAAAEGWGGDRYVEFTRGTTECVRAAFVGDSPQDLREISDALDDWVATMPDGAAHVERADGHATLTACESAATSAPSANALDAAVDVLTLRNDLFAELVAASGAGAARCIADKAATDPSLTALFYRNRLGRAERARLNARLDQFERACAR